MKTIGLIGGMSWESTLEYYRIINRVVRETLGGLHCARIVMHSFDFAQIAALQDEWWVVRYRAAEALGRIRDEGALSALEHALGDEKDHVRYMAAKGLGGYARQSSVDPLAPCLEDENEYVRKRAALSLGAIGGGRARALLTARHQKEQHPEVREAIAGALEGAAPSPSS